MTNVDYEHIDFYKNYKNLENAFIEFLNKTPPIGKSLVCIDNQNLKRLLKKLKIKIFSHMVLVVLLIIE